MNSFDTGTLPAPKDVRAAEVVITDTCPPFVSEPGWLEEIVDEAIKFYSKNDDIKGEFRKPPMALARCSRGGKTRALSEIAHRLSLKLPDAAIISISFNALTALTDWEQEDPIGAICRRIAYIATGSQNHIKFSDFVMNVLPAQIINWLGNQPSVLLIDELNTMSALTDKSQVAYNVCAFIKDNFISPKNRYFIFSSHGVSTPAKLSVFMDNNSGRDVLVRQLPIIPRFYISM